MVINIPALAHGIDIIEHSIHDFTFFLNGELFSQLKQNLFIFPLSLFLYLVAKSCLTLATPRTVAFQGPLSMRFSGQECWSGLPFLSPGDLPYPGIKPRPPALQADSLPNKLPRKHLI